jgi:hypothetical protein
MAYANYIRYGKKLNDKVNPQPSVYFVNEGSTTRWE